jgi:hypothetical protein
MRRLVQLQQFAFPESSIASSSANFRTLAFNSRFLVPCRFCRKRKRNGDPRVTDTKFPDDCSLSSQLDTDYPKVMVKPLFLKGTGSDLSISERTRQPSGIRCPGDLRKSCCRALLFIIFAAAMQVLTDNNAFLWPKLYRPIFIQKLQAKPLKAVFALKAVAQYG